MVPLSGKTLDMPWLAAQGQRVLGIELSERAIKSFFLEQELSDVVSDTPDGPLHRANDIAIIWPPKRAPLIVAAFSESALPTDGVPPEQERLLADALTIALDRVGSI